jgi:hypothetical protein
MLGRYWLHIRQVLRRPLPVTTQKVQATLWVGQEAGHHRSPTTLIQPFRFLIVLTYSLTRVTYFKMCCNGFSQVWPPKLACNHFICFVTTNVSSKLGIMARAQDFIPDLFIVGDSQTVILPKQVLILQ